MKGTTSKEVWLRIFIGKIINQNIGSRSAGEHADEGLREYRKRFPKEEEDG